MSQTSDIDYDLVYEFIFTIIIKIFLIRNARGGLKYFQVIRWLFTAPTVEKHTRMEKNAELAENR
jgi:hypothetical protein